MSFTDDQVGIETYDGSTQLLFPHPPIIEERWEEGSLGTSVKYSLLNTPCVVQYDTDQDKRMLRLFVRRLNGTQMATLQTLRTTKGLMYAKLEVGTSTTILCAFAPDSDQEWVPMIAEHPETDEAGDPVPAVLRVYEAHIVLVRME
jgi:hypothetical protein